MAFSLWLMSFTCMLLVFYYISIPCFFCNFCRSSQRDNISCSSVLGTLKLLCCGYTLRDLWSNFYALNEWAGCFLHLEF